MKLLNLHREKIYYTILFIFVFIFAFTGWKFVMRYENINHNKENPRHGYLEHTQSGMIRSWMTFKYINKVYNLPDDYLKKELNITDARYPNMTIDNKNMQSVKDAINKYGIVILNNK